MAISATLQLGEDFSFTKNFWDTYTVIGLDYTLERSVDKTGRPSSKASITSIKVTLRGIKQGKTPFHDWISKPDQKMSGDIKIYDSTGILSSMTQGVSGTDNMSFTEDILDVPIDMAHDSMDIGMDNASKYRDEKEVGLYDELSHKDLLAYARDKGVKLSSDDTDDDIRAKLERKDKEGQVEKEVNKMTEAELKEYCTQNGITAKDTWKIDDYKNAVKKDKMDKYDDDKKRKKHEDSAKEIGFSKLDSLKKKTSGIEKSALSNVEKVTSESARCISFKNAYCVSLREHFENNPKSEGELDKSYPWIIEIGIRPESVEVSGEEILGKAPGGRTKFEFF